MNIFHAIVLGVIEGLTEFLPISSTAHLLITSKIFRIPQTDFVKFFEVFIQSGAIFAVMISYIKYVRKHPEIIKKLFISFLPTVIIGFFLYKIIKGIFFESYLLISFALVGVGVFFIIAEELIRRKKRAEVKLLTQMGDRNAFLVGLFQSLAVIPGVSRSGIIMVGMMLLGFSRSDAAEYSFFLAVPTILAASVLDIVKMRNILIHSFDLVPVLMLGFFTSFLVAFGVIRWFIGYVQKNTLVPFAVYRIILGFLLFFL